MTAHILVIADGRSPTARSWIANIQALDYKVSLVSTFACDPPDGLANFYIVPIAFSRLSSPPPSNITNAPTATSPVIPRSFIQRFSPLFQTLRYWTGPLTLFRFGVIYQRLVREINPNLIHALRIPFEGMLGSYTPPEFPFLVATWGNDLTLHADSSPLMRAFTRRTLKRADGLTADTHRDIRLAQPWELSPNAPTLVVPGSGGLDLEAIHNAQDFDPQPYHIPTQCDWVINPRGLRPGSVHQDVFFASIPQVLKDHPNTCFICPGLAGNVQSQSWVDRYGIGKHTFLLPKLPQQVLWSVMKRSQLYVSPSSHDGTPNSLLEAMACGCFPVVGDIESLREWVKHQENGWLVDPKNPQDLAKGICQALEMPELRQKATDDNLDLVKERVERKVTRPRINTFYQQFIS